MLSDTFRYINLAELDLVLVAWRGPMHLCACVREERGDGESAGSQALSDTFRCINLAELALGLVVDRCTCVHVCARSVGTGRVLVCMSLCCQM